VLGRIVQNVDVLVGNEEDLQKGLGIPGPEVAAKSKLDPSAFFGMMDNVLKKHPHIKAPRLYGVAGYPPPSKSRDDDGECHVTLFLAMTRLLQCPRLRGDNPSGQFA